jgi:hypothetical protein
MSRPFAEETGILRSTVLGLFVSVGEVEPEVSQNEMVEAV